MKLATIYGSPTPPGKLSRGLSFVEEYVNQQYSDWTTYRLSSDNTGSVSGNWEKHTVDDVTAADAVIIASPVFRGSFPGTLKMLIDMLPNAALRSKPVGIFTVAAASEHFLSAERHLRDVLSWFGALTAPNSLFVADHHLATADINSETMQEMRVFADQIVDLTERNGGMQYGPEPLHVKMTASR